MLTMKKCLLLAVIATCGFLRGPSLTASSDVNELQLLRISRNADEALGSCILPPMPQHGSYSIVGETASHVPIPGTPVKEFKFLDIFCEAKYVRSTADRIYCSKGNWSEGNIACLKTCKPLQSSSIQYSCLNGGPVSCEQPNPAGTRAIISCKVNYKAVFVPGESIYCMPNGEWGRSLVICTPECGTTPTGSSLAINALQAHQHQFPWHAAIYDKKNSPVPNEPVFICGGTIVSANKIVSAAHCFWDGGKQKARSATSFAVGYSKEFSGWKNTDDEFGIYRDILHSFAQDIAIVVLLNVIEFNQMVKPICIDWNDDTEDKLKPGVLGTVPGWGEITEERELSQQLMQLNMPIVLRDPCKDNSPRDFRGFVTSDKICGGFGNGSSLCHGDSGGGFILYDNVTNVFNLKGVVSAGPTHKNGQCDSNQYTLFTSVSKFLQWLRDQKVHGETEVFICTSGKRITIEDKCDGIVDCDDKSDESEELCTKVEDNETSQVLAGSCIVPAKPENGGYTIYASKTVPSAWKPAKNGTMLEYKCNKDFVLTSGSIAYCSEGQWLPTLPRCKKPCKPLERGDGTILKCKLDKTVSVSCNGPLPPGTEVSVTCRSGFKIPTAFIFSPMLTCQEDSLWNFPLTNCTSDCGRTYKTKNEIDSEEMENEIKMEYGEEYLQVALEPWRAYIYEKIPDADPVLICSATLVEIQNRFSRGHNALATDRKCFSDAEGNLRDSSEFIASMAKIHSGWKNEKERFALFSGIQYSRALSDEPTIKGLVMFFQMDIDLLGLEISYLIRPACMDNHPKLLSTVEYKIPSRNIEYENLSYIRTVEADEEICPNQNGLGIISKPIEVGTLKLREKPIKLGDSLTNGNKTEFIEEGIYHHYLIGVLSLDKDKDIQCRTGNFSVTPIHHVYDHWT